MVYVYHIHITEVIRTWPDIQPVYFTYWGISPFGMTSFSEAFLRGLREAERVQSLEGDEPVWSLMKDGFFWGVVGVVSYPSVGTCLKIRTYQRPKETVEWDGNLRIWKFKDMYFYISAIYSYNDQYMEACVNLVGDSLSFKTLHDYIQLLKRERFMTLLPIQLYLTIELYLIIGWYGLI